MRDFLLTASQRDELEQQLRDTADAGVFRRTLALLEAANGRPIAEIARLLRTSRPSVYEWLGAYRAAPDPGSLVDHRGGNHPTLWTEELRALLAASLAQPPDRWGYAAVEWTIPLLQEHLARYGGVRPSANALRTELHQQEYAWKRPRRVLAPDPEREKKTPHSCGDPAPGAALGQAVRG
jgi:transposase